MRVERRVAELRRDRFLELLGERVLQALRLRVDCVPAEPERFREVELEQPVVAYDLERDAAAGLGQTHAAVALVRDETEPVELAQHPGDGGRLDAEPLGERVRRHGAAAALERVDRLRVVLDRGGQLVGRCRSSRHA